MPNVLTCADAELLEINDASHDVDMQEMLEQLATQWPDRFLVLKNENNLGFVRTVNHGVAYFSQYDVINLPRLFSWCQACRNWFEINGLSDRRYNQSTYKGTYFLSGLEGNVFVPLLQVFPPKEVAVRLIAFYMPLKEFLLMPYTHSYA